MVDFTKELSRELNNNYDYLKLLKVVYNTTFSNCLVQFIYPESQPTLTDIQKQEIKNAVQKILNIKGKLDCKFNKSYLDEKIVVSKIIEYMKFNYPSLNSCFNERLIEYSRDNFAVTITFNVNTTLYLYIDQNLITEKLKKFLNENFCGDFIVGIKEDNTDDFDEEMLEERAIEIQKHLKVESRVPRYKVTEPIVVFGTEIMPMPEYINNLKQEKTAVILAGNVKNLVQKEFLPKKNKLKGIDEKRHYYTFVLDDGTAKVNCIHFCTKISQKHFALVEEGTHIICLGDYVQRNNGDMQYMIKAISLCSKLEEENIEEPIEDEFDEVYTKVTPEPFVKLIQNTIFNESKELPDDIKNNTYVVFDVETTGLELAKNEIIEIGAVKIKNGQIVEKFQTLCKPHQKLTQNIIKLTGITDEMLENCYHPEEIISDFLLFCKGSTLIGYNVNFDYQFIQKTAKIANKNFTNPMHDCLVDARNKVYLPNYKLKTLVSHLGLKLDNAHRALYDATATAEAFLLLSLM